MYFKFHSKKSKLALALIIIILATALYSTLASAFGNTTSVSNKEIDEIMIKLNVKKYNVLGLKVNYDTYRRYHFFAYGTPFGTYSFGYSGEMEYRYLGYDYNGSKFTNDLFPNDATASDPRDRRYVKINGALESWKKVENSTIEHFMLYSDITDDGKKLDYSIADIFKGRCETIEEMKHYVYVNYPHTMFTNGSVTTRHIQ